MYRTETSKPCRAPCGLAGLFLVSAGPHYGCPTVPFRAYPRTFGDCPSLSMASRKMGMSLLSDSSRKGTRSTRPDSNATHYRALNRRACSTMSSPASSFQAARKAREHIPRRSAPDRLAVDPDHRQHAGRRAGQKNLASGQTIGHGQVALRAGARPVLRPIPSEPPG